ncbi:MAG: SGNH/GDSL hydrolase family protein, partial [Nitrospinota bacterium]
RKSEPTEGLIHYPGNTSPDMLMFRVRPNSQVRYTYASNPRGYFDDKNTLTVSINEKGFRGPSPSEVLKPGTLKLAFLGDSFTFGEGVRLKDTFSQKTAELLNEHPMVKEKKLSFTSYNFGMFAYNTAQEYDVFLSDVAPLKPDAVVLGYFLNDPAGPFFSLDSNDGSLLEDKNNPFWDLGSRPPENFLYKLRVARLLWKSIHRIRMRGKTQSYYTHLFSDENPHLSVNRLALQNMIQFCEKEGIPLIVVCLPVLHNLNGEYPFLKLHEKVKESVFEVKKNSTTFIDLFPHLKGKDEKEFWVHPTDHHPNESLHGIIARIISEALLENPVLFPKN